MVFIRKAFGCYAHTQKPKHMRAAHKTKQNKQTTMWKSVDMQILSNPFTRVCLISDSHHQSRFSQPDSLIFHYFVRPWIESLLWNEVLNLLNRCRFHSLCSSKAVGDFDAFSMFAAEESPCDLRSLSCLNPGPPSPCPKSKVWIVKNT